LFGGKKKPGRQGPGENGVKLMTPNPTLLSGASQFAAMLAQQSGPGFSKDPSDYMPPWVKLSGSEFNEADPKYNPRIEPLGFLIGENVISPAGAKVIVLGTTSGFEEVDRVIVKGEERRRRFAVWKTKPDADPIKGKGGGLKTARGGWLKGRIDEIFMLSSYGVCVMTLFDQHNVTVALNQSAQTLGVHAMYEIGWVLTKEVLPADDSGYEHIVPHFGLLGVSGENEGPTKAEMTRAEKLSRLIDRISFPIAGIPLRLVANSPIGEPPADRATPV
jgi:hypothetical protein